MADAAPGEIQAAGAVLWRVRSGSVETALVHRPRYDDWSFPKGKSLPGEHMLLPAVREVEEETGWRPGSLTPLLRVEPTPGISTSVHHLYRACTATRIGRRSPMARACSRC